MKEGKNVVDNERDQWIRAHTEKYRMGRPDDTDPRIDLGQWYIIFTQIFPGIKIPEPCKLSIYHCVDKVSHLPF